MQETLPRAGREMKEEIEKRAVCEWDLHAVEEVIPGMLHARSSALNCKWPWPIISAEYVIYLLGLSRWMPQRMEQPSSIVTGTEYVVSSANRSICNC